MPKKKVQNHPKIKKTYQKNPFKPMYSLFQDLNLKPKQIKFIIIYCNNNFNGRKAYLEAGYKSNTEGAMDSTVSILLKNKKVLEGLRRFLDSILGSAKTELEKRLFDTFFHQAFYDPEMFYNLDGTVKASSWDEIPKEYHCCIESLEQRFYGKDADKKVTILKLIDRKWAQDKLDKYIQMTKDTKAIEFVNIPEDKKRELAKTFEGKI